METLMGPLAFDLQTLQKKTKNTVKEKKASKKQKRQALSRQQCELIKFLVNYLHVIMLHNFSLKLADKNNMP